MSQGKSVVTETVGEKEIKFDERGFLVDPSDWNPDLARFIAAREGLGELTEEHWNVLRYTRRYWLLFHQAPPAFAICRGAQVNLRRFCQLFPGAHVELACKIAGTHAVRLSGGPS